MSSSNENVDTVILKCLFCSAPLKSDKANELESGDTIDCSECGELNDFDSTLEVAIEEGQKIVADRLHKSLNSAFGKRFKKA